MIDLDSEGVQSEITQMIKNQVTEKVMNELRYQYDQIIDRQNERIKELETRLKKLEESFLWAAYNLQNERM